MITASQVERLERCPASASLPQVDEVTEAAERGTTIHGVFQRAADVGPGEAIAELDEEHADLATWLEELPWDELPVGDGYAAEVALAYDVATGEGREIGRGLSREEAYADLGPFEVGGITDIIGLATDHVLVVDVKTGWSERPAARRNPQLMTLALAAARAYGRHEGKGWLLRLPERGRLWFSRGTYDVFDLAGWAQTLKDLHARVAFEARQVAAGAVEAHLGPWCRWCPAHRACPAQNSLIRKLGTGELESETRSILPLTAENFSQAWHQIEVLGGLHKRAKSEAIAFARRHGPLPLGDGRYIGEVVEPGNERLDGDIAHEVLAELRGEDVALAAVGFKATKKGIREALKESLEDGETLAAAEREVIEAIRNRGGADRPARKSVKVYEGNGA